MDYIHWFFFAVVISLAHLIVAILIWTAAGRAVRFAEVIKDGSLLFFAAALSATTYGDYRKVIEGVPQAWSLAADDLAVLGLILIMLPMIAIYACMVLCMTTGVKNPISPRMMSRSSYGLVCAAILYASTIVIWVNRVQRGV